MSKYPPYRKPTTDEEIDQLGEAWASFIKECPGLTMVGVYGFSRLWCDRCGKGHIVHDPYWPPDTIRTFSVQTCSLCDPTVKDWVPPNKAVSPK